MDIVNIFLGNILPKVSEAASDGGMSFIEEKINDAFGVIVSAMAKILFFEIFSFPLVVIVLAAGAIIFTFYFRFIGIRGIKHSIDIISGKYDNPNDVGQISHFQALTSALSATIGLGNIAGVAIAIAKGGAGAVFWMMAIAVFGMTAKFVSASLGQLFRQVHDDGRVSGGPMYYLSIGLEQRGFSGLGKFLGGLYAVFIIMGAFGGGNMFQANQSYELAASQVPILADNAWLYGIILSGLVGLVIFGGIVRIGKSTSKVVPLMLVTYVGASLFIIFSNLERLPGLIASIFTQAFNPEAFYGGVIGVMVLGIQRAAFSNEAGVGSASIAHSAAKTDEPIREGMVAMIGPFIDTIAICSLTAMVLLITIDDNPILLNYTEAKSEYYSAQILLENASTDTEISSAEVALHSAKEKMDANEKGAQLTSIAFGSVLSWFPIILAIVVFLFSYSTMISWFYYGVKGWAYLFGNGSTIIYKILFLLAVVVGSVSKLGNVLDFSDMAILSCAFPNIIGAMFLLPYIKEQLDSYWKRYKAGEFQTY